MLKAKFGVTRIGTGAISASANEEQGHDNKSERHIA
jgi:hypothetical protein